MRTKMGEKILNRNSKEMDALNAELIALAEQLDRMNPKDKSADGEWKAIERNVKRNRERHKELRDELNAVSFLEQYGPDRRLANPRGR